MSVMYWQQRGLSTVALTVDVDTTSNNAVHLLTSTSLSLIVLFAAVNNGELEIPQKHLFTLILMNYFVFW